MSNLVKNNFKRMSMQEFMDKDIINKIIEFESKNKDINRKFNYTLLFKNKELIEVLKNQLEKKNIRVIYDEDIEYIEFIKNEQKVKFSYSFFNSANINEEIEFIETFSAFKF